MTVIVREFQPEDAEAVAGVRRAAVPYLVCTGEALLWEMTSYPAARRNGALVAEEADGTLIGCAQSGLVAGTGPGGEGYLHTVVRPEATGRGAGAALAAAGERRLAGLGAGKVLTWVPDDGRSPGFAERRGYARSRTARFLGLDLARAPLPALPEPLPAGAALRTVADFGDDLRPLYEADVECAADEPGDVETGPTAYEDWLRLNWRRPDFDAELSSVALVGGEVAAYSVAQTDGVDRYWSGMTGTRRAFRGRGLARLAKLDSLLRSRAAGYRHAYTGNDASNAPMLAINHGFGYTLAGSEWRYVREL
ncbi:GNAT family N-acetyltransferase [Streptomyces boncukensis]|uniref:GNAT family N-acetyltransferase n=1 Tax=Streptomyces boncukensis TaxID=2711219 RepID=A0A6G4X9J7_9ACTN|nr:GNAT family N-acetyltransferase [Streptomyces boncukensis]NGO73424.1 GNAT family N-acetyltransferase [Streptomyces boncukensis]